MKKKLLLCLALSFSIAGFSQNVQKEYSLAEIRSSDDLEYEKYRYSPDGLLIEMDVLLEDGTQVKESLTYDASHNLIKIDGYQMLGGNWIHVSYIEYNYDNDGNRISRSNYNSFGGSAFTLGGVYNYHYTDSRLSSWELYMGGTDLYEIAVLTYDTDGKLIEELAQDTWNSSSWENSWRIVYQYNADGTLETSNQSFWNGVSWDIAGTEWFYYDDNKNCIKWETKNGNTVINKNEYEYDLDVTVDQIVLPLNPEAQSEKKNMVTMLNKVNLYHWYTENDQGNLVYVCDYIYTYDNRGTAGIADSSLNPDNFSIYPNPSSDYVTILSGKNNIHNIDIIDTAGKSVLKVSKVNKKEVNLDVSSLSSGIYHVRLSTPRGIITQKMIKE